jgi:hypothetical protein
MDPTFGPGYAAVVFADGRSAQQHGEARTAAPHSIAAWASKRWLAGWDAGDATETAAGDLLIDMPELGGWMLGVGKHSAMLTELLDDDSLLIQEESLSESDVDLMPWRVRLTKRGMVARARIVTMRKTPTPAP